MKYKKDKLNAMRYYLAQLSEPGIEIRNKVINMREFRTKAAERLYQNPFLTGDKEIYVLTKLCEWADIIFPPNWELYATEEGIVELIKALKHEPYTPVTDTGYTARRVRLQQCKTDFFNTTKED